MARHDLFSKRNKPLPDVFQTEVIPQGLRIQIYHLWQDTLLQANRYVPRSPEQQNVYLQVVHDNICREKGRFFLYEHGVSHEVDVANALLYGTDIGIVLDIIEASFSLIAMGALEEFGVSTNDVTEAIEDLNYRFREHGVGYQFDITTHQLIPINSTVIHEEAIRPALALLARKLFATANKEYLEAWDDFKKSDYGDCLTKCNSCFESMMKIVCSKKGWAFDPKDTAGPLIKTIINETGMESFFDQPLLLIATMRNRLSSSHGKGTTPTNPPIHIARYALNATASAILLLVEATGV